MSIKSIIGPKKQIGLVTRKTLIARNIFEFEIRLPELMIFKPGQYVSVKVNEAGMRRSYSVAKLQKGLITLLVDITPAGVGSRFFESLVIGDSLEVMGFLGNFVLDMETISTSKKVFFVATGTGIVPFLPMIKKLLESGFSGKVNLWWGVRNVSGLYWQEEIKEVGEGFENFEFKMYVSQPETEWNGEVGRVGKELSGMDVEESVWYLCGSPNMIEEIKDKLRIKNVQDDFINYEKFF